VCNRASIDGLTHPRCVSVSAIDGCFVSLSYTGVVRKLLYTYKFQPYLSSLSDTLVDLFYEGIIQNESFYRAFSQESVFVPIPLHPSKLKSRGYDQVMLLSQKLSKRLGVRTVQILRRVLRTHSQYGLGREERMANVKDAFALTSGVAIDRKVTIFLVDDVVTSGATFLSAARSLKKAGYKRVYGLALAHGQ
jgi:competence protein ComFC